MRRWSSVLIALAVLLARGHAQCPLTKITAERGVPSGGFGSYLAIQGDELFVASMKSDTTGARPGSIYVTRREGSHWYREAEIVGPPEVRIFGIGLEVEGDTLVAAGRLRDGTMDVFLYRRAAGAWELRTRLRSMPMYSTAHFAAIEGDRIAIGALTDLPGGAVRIYADSPSGWQLEQVVRPQDGAPFSSFGCAVDFEGDRLAIGAQNFGLGSGATYVFEERGGAWLETARLTVHGGELDAFGSAVSLDGEQLAAAAGWEQTPGSFGMGYVFEHRAGAWLQVARLGPELSPIRDGFGLSLELMGERLFASGVFHGYLFRKGAAGWEPDGVLVPWDEEPDVVLFTSGAASSDFAVLGSSGENANTFGLGGSDQRAWESGALYAYSLGDGPCASLRVTLNPISYGRHDMKISRGPASAGNLYWLLGSMSGTSPGFRLRGERVPLNQDSYFLATALSPNRWAFTSNLGRLDANGEATIRLEVPPEAALYFADRNADHAFLEFAAGRLVHVSNVTQVRFGDRL